MRIVRKQEVTGEFTKEEIESLIKDYFSEMAGVYEETGVIVTFNTSDGDLSGASVRFVGDALN